MVDGDLITAYGYGLDACWNGLMDRRSAVKPLTRFGTEPFQCHNAAVVDGLTYRQGESVVWQMIQKLFAENDPRVPDDAVVLLASTTGEIDLLEQAVDAGESDCSESRLGVLLDKICARLSDPLVGQASCIQEPVCVANRETPSRIRDGRPAIKKREGCVISSACASATVALAQGAEMIEQGECDCVAVVACDAVTEFVYSGFASLMALDPEGARPFDAQRRGLSAGEAAGFILLMSADRATREGRAPLGELAGWGMSNDANHMTGPSRNGTALAQAIVQSLKRGGVEPDRIGFICAHGTGTMFNDSMELKAFKTVFDRPRTIFSVKGGTGHTMGAAGLVEALLTLRALAKQTVPPTVSLEQMDEEACGWVSAETVFYNGTDLALSTNSGFGGVNAALVLRRAAS
jgi:3-oxoacyl-[acyl-carrier-protein] synthase II